MNKVIRLEAGDIDRRTTVLCLPQCYRDGGQVCCNLCRLLAFLQMFLDPEELSEIDKSVFESLSVIVAACALALFAVV